MALNGSYFGFKTPFVYFLMVFNVLFLNTAFSQNIPDANFANAIRTACPTCIDGSNNLTTDASTLTSLDVSNKNISNLTGLGGFVNLQILNCSQNQLTALPTLPNSLFGLICYRNQLTSLPTLHNGLTAIYGDNNQLTSLPTLPSTMQTLYVGGNQLASLPALPSGLLRFSCWSNAITTLPTTLPSGLLELGVYNTPLSNLPNLPSSLQYLSCYQTNITCLPTLPMGLTSLLLDPTKTTCLPNMPTNVAIYNGTSNVNIRNTFAVCLPSIGIHISDANFAAAIRAAYPTAITLCNDDLTADALTVTSLDVSNKNISNLTGLGGFVNLQILNCSQNQLTALPALPNSLFGLICYRNQLTSLPTLHNGLTAIYSDNNQLTTLPTLPSTMQTLYVGGNQLTSLPALPSGLLRFSCWSNAMTTLPTTLPSGLLELGVYNTPLSNLPNLPSSLQYLSCYQTNITCLPTLPMGLTSLLLDPTKTTCLPNMPTNVAIYNGTSNVNIRNTFAVCLPSIGIHISDANFAAAIRAAYPTAITFCNDDLTADALTVTSLDVSNKNISNLTGLGGFVNLQSFYSNYNPLTSLPSNLPSGLTTLSCANTSITTLPTLPNGLTALYCGNTFLNSLPTLPNTLRTLDCSNAYLTALSNTLPSGLLSLNCKNNQLTALPVDMPFTLTEVNCDNNALTALPVFSSALRFLYCRNNQITNLLSVPFSSLSSNLRYLYCTNNRLTSLPENLPSNLLEIECYDNNIYCLPMLPNSLTQIKLDALKIKCLSNLVAGLVIQNRQFMDDISADYALCNAPSITTHPSVSGSPQGGQPTSFTANATNNSVTTVKWQRKSATDMAFTDIAGTEMPYTHNTDATYNTPNLTVADVGASYRAYFTSQCSGDVFSNAVTLNFMVLPVELLSFSGKNIEEGNLITWSTAEEKNMAHFDIERSIDGRFFKKIGKALAKGSNSNYTFMDTHPLPNIAFYRLKINDLNGETSFSKIISIEAKGQTKVKIYPTLTTGTLTVENAKSYTILNAAGQVMLNQQQAIHQSTVNIHHLTSGLYIIRGVDTKGRYFVEKIVKQ